MPRRYKRTIDLLQLTALLQTHVGGMSMNEIAERFDLSRRTAERMMAALRENFPHLESKIRDGRKYWHFARSGDGGSLRVPPEFSSFAQPLTDPALSALRDALMRLFEVTQKTLDSVNHREASLGPLASFVSRINRNVEATGGRGRSQNGCRCTDLSRRSRKSRRCARQSREERAGGDADRGAARAAVGVRGDDGGGSVQNFRFGAGNSAGRPRTRARALRLDEAGARWARAHRRS
jgi:hypothetical protein